MFGSVLEVTSETDLKQLATGDSRYEAAINSGLFVMSPREQVPGRIDNKYNVRIKNPWAFASWVRDSGLFSESEVDNLILWVAKDHF